MQVEHRASILAKPDEIFAFITSPDYYAALVPRLARVENIELLRQDVHDDGTSTRVSRYTARAELPRFLKRFEDKAPEFVTWEERARLDPKRRELRYEIVPDMPERWHSLYSNAGELSVEALPDGVGSDVVQRLEFNVSVPGLSLFIGRALRDEIGGIFETQAALLRERFGTRA